MYMAAAPTKKKQLPVRSQRQEGERIIYTHNPGNTRVTLQLRLPSLDFDPSICSSRVCKDSLRYTGCVYVVHKEVRIVRVGRKACALLRARKTLAHRAADSL